jgi:hypothetical protein
MKNRNLLQKFVSAYFANMTVFSVLFTCIVLLASPSFGANIPITIDIGASTSVANYAVSSGIPFPIGAVTDISTLRMLDSNSTAVPCQFATMVNWPDGSVKIAKATFVPSVSGNSYDRYSVRYQNSSGIAVPTVTNPITVTDNGTQQVVNTGVATFYINKSTFTVFDQVSINGVNQMQSAGDIVFVDNITGNTFKTSLGTNYTLTLAESGAMRTTFLATGRAKAVGSGANQFGENTLVTVKLWMTFYANSGRADLKYTWIDDVARYNPNNYWGGVGIPHFVEIKSNHIDLPLTETSSNYTFGGNGANYSGVISGTDYLLQDAIVTSSAVPQNPQGNGWDYVFTYSGVGTQAATGGLNGGVQLPADLTGGRAPGWMDITRGTTGVTAGIKDFWQNFPNKLSITDQGLLQIFVQPDESSNIMYTIAPGVAKTHDIYLDFHADTDTTTASKKFLIFNEHAIINTGASWYAQTKAFGPISAPDANSVYWDAQMDAQADCTEYRSNCSAYIRSYGKRDYGDYIGGNTTGGGYLFYDQHYEDAHGWILQYLRLGRKRYFDFAESYVRHHVDLDVMHVGWPGYSDNGNVPGMIHWHGGGDHEVSGVETGHTVPGGIDEYYLLTGDPRMLEVSKEQGAWCVNHALIGGMRVVPEFTGDPVRGYEYERAQAWVLYTLLKTYESTNDIKYFDAATIGIKNSIDWWKYKQPIVQFAPGAQPSATLTNGSNVLVFPDKTWRWYFDTNFLITGNGIPTGTVVSSITTDAVANTTTIIMSNAATTSGTNVALSISPNITTTSTVTNPPSSETLASVQAQALYYEALDYTKGNGYFLSSFKTDNSRDTNIPVSSDPSTWVYQNHIPIAWMGAYFQSAIIRYLDWFKITVGTGPYIKQLSYRVGDSTAFSYYGTTTPTFTVDQPTIKEMLVQTANMLVTHDFAGGGQYASVIPWISPYSTNKFAYSMAPDYVLPSQGNSSDGNCQMPWILSYIATNFQPSDLLFPHLWDGTTGSVTDWATLTNKFQSVATLACPYNTSSFNLSSNTGYDGAPVIWNMPYTMSLSTSTALVNGTCGSSNTGVFSTIPTINLCVNGTATGVTGSGPWSWTCVGSNGGSTATCSASYSSSAPSGSGSSGGGGSTTTGVCGSSNGAEAISAPTGGLCTVGAASAVTGFGPWYWTCLGTDNNYTPCSAYPADPYAYTYSCSGSDTGTLPSPWLTAPGRTPIQIVSNTCTDTNDTAGSQMYNTQILGLDQYSRVTFATSAAACGVSVRSDPSSVTGYFVLTDGTSADVLRVIAGSATTIASFSTFGLNTGDTLKAAVIGSTIYAYKNGALIGSYTDPTPITTAGYPGAVLYHGGTITAWSGNVIVTGTCGAANGTNSSVAPSANLCGSGTASSITGTGPWNWTCAGTNGGTTASCSAQLSVNGICGSANNQSFISAPASNLCQDGSSPAVTGSGPWSWLCAGSGGGSTVNCSALLQSPATFSCTGANTNTLPAPWVTVPTDNPIEILSQQCVQTSTSGRMYNSQVFSADQYSQATFTTVISGSGIILRANPTEYTQYQVLFDGTSADFYRIVSGTSTYLGHVSAFSWNSGDTLRGSIVGSTLSAYKNGVLIGSITDPNPITAPGYPGVSLYNGGIISSWSGNAM